VKLLTIMPVFRLIAFCLLCGLLNTSFAASAGELKVWSGGRTPALTLRDIDGKTHDLAAYRGKVVLVNFWATWCEPCRDEMPAIQRLKKKLAGKPFVVLAVNVDEPESRIHTFLEKMPLDFPILLDAGKVATKAWKVSVLPASFIIGRDGRTRYSLTGELAWDHDTVVSLLAELMQSR
jgi:thiol-disulfide isomerase/thioredoxin